MIATERETLIDALTVLAEYYDKPKSDAQILIYVQALDDLALDAVLAAITALVKSTPFFPKVSEIRGQVLGEDGDTAELAWMAMVREVRRRGWTWQPNFPEATMETIRGLWGSWEHLCETLPGEGPALLGWAKRFQSAYVAVKHRAECPELIGRDEAKQLLDNLTGRPQRGTALPSAYREPDAVTLSGRKGTPESA